MRQHKSAVLPFAHVHAIRISYQTTQHVSDVTACSRDNNAPFACDVGGGSSLQRHHDKAAHHTRKDAIHPNLFLPCGNKHSDTGRRDDKPVSCEDDTASQEAPQQLRREFELPDSGESG